MKKGEDYTSRIVQQVGAPAYRRGYDPTLFYIDGREYSFEEVRAARHGHVDGLDEDDADIIYANTKLKALEQEKKNLAKQASGNGAADLKKRKEEEDVRKRKLREDKMKKLQEEELALARLKRGANSPSGNGEKHEGVNKRRRESLEASPATTQAKITSAKKSRTSIGKSQPLSKARDDDGHNDKRPTARSPTMTVNTKAALAKVLPMFSDTNTTMGSSSKGSTTPTMTINTKTAHSAIASMFSAPLSFDEEEGEDTAQLAAAMMGGDRENARGGNGAKRKGPLAVHQQESKVTYGDVLKEFGHGSAYARSPKAGGKKTNGDAIREALSGMADEDEAPEDTQEYVDTASLSQVKNRGGGGFQIYEDLDASASSPPKPRRLEMTKVLGDNGDRDESYLAAFDDTQQLYDADQSTTFGAGTPMKAAALKVFEDVDCGGNRTRDLSLSNIRCFVDTDGNGEHTNHGASPVRIRSITGDEADLTMKGGNSPSFFSTTANNSTGSFSGFTPSPSRHSSVSTSGRSSGNSATRRSSRRTSAAHDQGVTPLTYRKGYEPHAAPPRTPFAPKNENLPPQSPNNTPSPLKKESKAAAGVQVLDPFCAAVMKRIRSTIEPQIRTIEGYIDASDEKAPGARILKVPKGRRISVGGLDPSLQLKDCPPLEVERRIGEGAFASVHLVERTDVDPMYSKPLALKVQDPPTYWEWYIYHQLQDRVPEDMLHCFVKFWSIHMYKDKSLILMDYHQHSLQDVISLHRTSAKPMDEVLAIYYTIEMMKTLETMHKTGFIHGDIKPDNWLVRNDPCDYWDNWGTGAQGGWDTKGLILIDFGKCIDTSLFPPSTRFTGDIGADTFTCPEMKEGRPWTFQADYFAMLGVVHCMLYSDYMQTVQYKEGGKTKLKLKENFKRYWQAEKLWKPLFDSLLNVEDCDHLPELGPFIRTFEDYLVSSRKAQSVRTLLSKQGIMLHEHQNKINA